MAKVSVQIANLDIKENALSGRPDIKNRFLFQWVHPQKQDDNPVKSFTLDSVAGQISPAALAAAVPDGILFKNQEYSQVFAEPLTLQVHHFLDAHRDILQIILGKVFELMLSDLLGQVSIGPISLNKVIDPSESLKLSAETYSLKIGHCKVTLDPNSIPTALPPLRQALSTIAQQDVHALGALGPAGRPPQITVVTAGQVGSEMTLNFIRS